ncbi:hypothetical protein ACFXKR_40955 [Streptomyces violascens]
MQSEAAHVGPLQVTHLWWTDPADGRTGVNSRAQIGTWIEGQKGRL